jgi:hypothetical protein
MPSEMQELKLRVEAKKKQLEAQIAKFKASSVSDANETLEKLQQRLNSLESDLKHGWVGRHRQLKAQPRSSEPSRQSSR